MKKLLTVLSLVLALCTLAGCVGTPVIYHADLCTCPADGGQSIPDYTVPPFEGALKTGLAILTDVSGSKSASDKDGEGKYDITMIAVLVDDEGIIRDCKIDGVSASVNFNAAGAVTTDLKTEIKTKNELEADYGMVAWGQAKAEWNEQAAAFARYVIGKSADEVSGIAVDAGTKPTEADLSSSVTIAVGGFKSAVVKAVSNAKYLGAQGGESLRLSSLSSVDGSKNVTEKSDGLAQLELTATALTVSDGKITSCTIDSVQAKVNFDATGKITTDLKTEIKTKNELGADYGMVAWGQAKAEWNEQAASFARYVTGKSADEVSGIAVDAGTKPTGADLSSSVTIAIGGFKSLIAKAAK